MSQKYPIIGGAAKGDKREFAKGMRNNRTPAEEALGNALISLRRRGFIGVPFKTQHLLAGFIVDIIYGEKRLVVEADGAVHSEQSVEDAIRDVALARRGYLTVRFTNEEILANPRAIAFEVAELLRIDGRYGPSLREFEELAGNARPKRFCGRPTPVELQMANRRGHLEDEYRRAREPTWSERHELNEAQVAYGRVWWPWLRPAAQRRLEATKAKLDSRRAAAEKQLRAELDKLNNPALRQQLNMQYARDLTEFEEHEQQQARYDEWLQAHRRIETFLDALERDLTGLIGRVLPVRQRCRSIIDLLKEARRVCDELRH